jgi:hypothetical protein
MAVPKSERMLSLLVKTERAEQHVDDLCARIRAFFETNPYQVIFEDDPKTGDRVFRVRVVSKVPLEIAAAFGDVIHNLRSALDHLAYQLVLANGATPTTSTAYPVCKDVKDYKTKGASKVQGMSGAAVDLIDATKPYKGGNDDLWRLHQLDIIDKHRLLITAGGLCPVIALDFTPLARSQDPEMIGVQLPTIALPTRNQSIVEDGTEIHRIPRFAEHPDMHTQPQFPPDIAINEPTVGCTESVPQTLDKFFRLVGGVIGRFAHLL